MDKRIPLLRESLTFLARKYPKQLLDDFDNRRQLIAQYSISPELENRLRATATVRLKEIRERSSDRKPEGSVILTMGGGRAEKSRTSVVA